MFKDKIFITSCLISGIIFLLATLIFDNVAIGIAFAVVFFPASRNLAKRFYRSS